MNILIVNQYAGSPELGMEFRPYYLAQEWGKMGHHPVVVTGDFSHLRQKNPRAIRDFEEKTVEGVRYCFLKTPAYAGNGLGRVKNVFAFCRKLYSGAARLAKTYRPDVVIASSTHPFDGRGAARIARIAKAKLIYEVHDLWPLSPMELYGYKAGHPLIHLIRREVRRLSRKSDGVVSILEKADLYLASIGASPKNYQHIPNGVDFREEPENLPPKKHQELLELLHSRGHFVLLYLGGFSAANALEDLVFAAALAPPGIAFVLMGDGPYKNELRSRAKKLRLDNLYFLDPAPKGEATALLPMADALYLGAKRSPLYQYGVGMNKLFDYLLSGRPILYGVAGAGNLVERSGCGLTLPPEDPRAIVEGAKALLALSHEERAELGKRGKDYVRDHHRYDRLAKEYIDYLTGL